MPKARNRIGRRSRSRCGVSSVLVHQSTRSTSRRRRRRSRRRAARRPRRGRCRRRSTAGSIRAAAGDSGRGESGRWSREGSASNRAGSRLRWRSIGATIRIRPRKLPTTDPAPMAMSSEKADEPSGRWARMSRARPPTKAQVRPASRPPAMAAMTPKTRTGCGTASPTFRYGTTVNSTSAATTASAAAMVKLHHGVRSSADEPTVGRRRMAAATTE